MGSVSIKTTPNYVPDMEYIMEKLIDLLNIPSVSGNTHGAVGWLGKQFEHIGFETSQTNKGGLLVKIPGENFGNERLLSAHVDTLGAMVFEVKSNGRLKLSLIGGDWHSIEGERVFVEASSGKRYTGTALTTKAASHVYGAESSRIERNQHNMEVRLDEKVTSKEDTLSLGIKPGDFVSFDPRADVTPSGFVRSRHLDDKASCAVLLGAAKYLVDNGLKPAYTTYLFVTNYEEVGHGASCGIPETVREMVAVDMGCVGDGLLGSEYTVSICAKDSSGPYDLQLRKRLEELCEENQIPYAVDIFPYYGSDASAALRAGANIRAGLIGTGVDASHAHERTHKEGVLATARLAIAYMLSE
jgi:putative aminopeptidase FrvX